MVMAVANSPGPSQSLPDGPAHIEKPASVDAVPNSNEAFGQESLASFVSQKSVKLPMFVTGTQTPNPLVVETEQNISERMNELQQAPTQQTTPHMGNALEDSLSAREGFQESYELYPTVSRRLRASAALGRLPSPCISAELPDEHGSSSSRAAQGIPSELRNLASEVVFVLVCSAGQLLFAWFLADVNVNQAHFKQALGIKNTQLPWLIGSFNIANGLSVVLSGSLTDLLPPKSLIVGAFAWLSVWNIVGVFALTPTRSPLFFVMRAMQGLAVGVLVSGSMSMLGRIHNPGIRKTRGMRPR